MATNNNNENGTKFYLNSGLFPCIEVGMYESPLSSMSFEDKENEMNREDGEEYTYCKVNQEDWEKELTEAANDWLQDNVIDVLRNYGCMAIEGTGIWSPRYYNFDTDRLEMTITMQENWRDIMAEKVAGWRGNKEIEKYICRHWHSCSGFISFMPYDLDELLTESDEDRQVAGFLTLALLAENALEGSEDGDEYGSLWTLAEIMDERFTGYENINVIAEYLGDDEADRLIRLWHDTDRWNELYWRLAEKIGFQWLHEPETRVLEGKKNFCMDFNAGSDGERLLFWAAQQGHTVSDLYSMAA